MSHADPPFEAPPIETLNALLPAYAFELLIAQGGMGAVYKARQKSLDREVAVKILPPVFSADASFRKSFETEARAMARLNHPNLISVFDSGDLGEMLFIVMEYVPGKSLYHSAYGMKVDPVQAVGLVRAICDGLAHAHDNGILHRDIKPANILLNAKAEPKIGDFGLALPADADGPGLIMGTPGYTAPEVMRHPESADRRSDLYAVGVILYELLTGERQRPDSRPPSLVCGCDTALDRIWQRATNPNPGLRYADGHAFAHDLESWLGSHKPHAAHAHAAHRPGHPAPPMRVPAARRAAPVIKRRSSGGLVWLLVLAALGIGGYFAWQNRAKLADSKPPVSSAVPGSELAPPPPVSKPAAVDSFDEKPAANAGGKPAATTTVEDTLTPKAKDLIKQSEAERVKQLTENVRWLNDSLAHWVRNVPARERGEREAVVTKVQAGIRNSRVSAAGSQFPPDVQRVLGQAAEREKQIDSAFTTRNSRYRDLYVSKMREKISLAEQGGQSSQADALKRRLETAGDLDTWIRSLGGAPVQERTTPGSGALESIFGKPAEE